MLLLQLAVAVVQPCVSPEVLAAANRGSVVNHVAHNCSGGRYFAAVKAFYRLSATEKRKPEVCYATGYAWMRLHRPEMAKGLLVFALCQGFEGYRGWESTGDLLSRVSQTEKFKPPLLKAFHDATNLKIRVYGRQTDWSKPVFAAMPDFMTRAREIFGADYPAIDFYFFEARDHFDNFYSAMFGTRSQKWWHNGTGTFNVVAYCERHRDGSVAGVPGAPRNIGNVLHEYGHALLSTYYGDGYLRVVPNWLNEGLADAVARPLHPELFNESRERVSGWGRNGVPPTYKQMCRELYDDPDVRYAVARLMVEELLNGEPDRIKRILNEARRTRSFERALKSVTGYEGRYWHRRIVARYWKAHIVTTPRRATGPG
jgi:hypothetical protein